MPKEVTVMLDLTNPGSRVIINTKDGDVGSFSTPFAGMMGSAVIEVKRLVNGIEQSFSPALTISSSNQQVSGVDLQGIDEVALVVTTADSSAADMPVDGYTEELEALL